MSAQPIIMYGTTWCPDCTRSKRLLEKKGVQYNWCDIEKEPLAREYVVKVNQGKRRVPTIVFPDGTILVEPSDAELAKKIEPAK